MAVNNVGNTPQVKGAGDAPVTSPRETSEGRTGPVRISTDKGDGVEGKEDVDGLQAILNQHGLTVELPESARSYVEGLPPALQTELSEIGKQISQISGAYEVGGGGTGTVNINGPTAPAIQEGTDSLQSRWGEYMGKVALNGNMDVNALVQWVLRESYMETTQDLRFYAEKVKFYNGVKKAIRDELTAAREEMAKYAGKDDNHGIGSYPAKGIETTFTGMPEGELKMSTGAYQGKAVDTKGKLEAYIKGLEEKLSSVGDDAQLANVDLQNMLQKQQQTLQMMSNISKMLHDTAMAIVRKIGG